MRQNKPVSVDRLASLNDPVDAFKAPAQLSFMRVLIDIIRQISSSAVTYDTAAPHIILLSPNGTAYRVTVNDTGVLTTVNARVG